VGRRKNVYHIQRKGFMKTTSQQQPTGAAQYLTELFESSGKTQKEVATTVGIKPSAVSMILSGAMKLPATRAAAFAQALGGDEYLMMQLVIEEHYPPLSSFILEGKRRGSSVTPAEMDFIKAVRIASEGTGLTLDIQAMLGNHIKANAKRMAREHQMGTPL
jgi:transcriptional regulator with XRE-family HTH domain